jgi:hypothetical protein
VGVYVETTRVHWDWRKSWRDICSVEASLFCGDAGKNLIDRQDNATCEILLDLANVIYNIMGGSRRSPTSA